MTDPIQSLLEQTALRRDEDGVWRPPTLPTGPVSYPADGHRTLAELEDRSAWFRHRNRCLAAALERFPPAGVLLDLGGGNGFVSQGLQALGYRCLLLEPGPEGISTARRRGVEGLAQSTLGEAGFPPGSLPAAGMFDVLEHVEDDVGFLRTLRRVLQPEGRLYLTVPAYGFLWSQQDSFAGHFRRYTRSGLSRVLEHAGFRVEFASYFVSLLVGPVLALRTLPSLLGLSRDPAEHLAREHGMLSSAALEAALAFEPLAIRAGVPLRLGTSCLVVASRPAGQLWATTWGATSRDAGGEKLPPHTRLPEPASPPLRNDTSLGGAEAW